MTVREAISRFMMLADSISEGYWNGYFYFFCTGPLAVPAYLLQTFRNNTLTGGQ